MIHLLSCPTPIIIISSSIAILHIQQIFPYTNHKGTQEGGDKTPFIPNLDTSWKWEVSFTHQPLYTRGNKPLDPYDAGSQMDPKPVWKLRRTRKFVLTLTGIRKTIPLLPLNQLRHHSCIKLLVLLSPSCRVSTIIYRKQTMFLGYILLQRFCVYNCCYR